jgi:hypothetical protein
MPSPEELRSNARKKEAEALVRWALENTPNEQEHVTADFYLLARLIVAVESLEAKIDQPQRGR